MGCIYGIDVGGCGGGSGWGTGFGKDGAEPWRSSVRSRTWLNVW
jgi:hypothetical protein